MMPVMLLLVSAEDVEQTIQIPVVIMSKAARRKNVRIVAVVALVPGL